jgi:hypothetical protein
VDCNNPRSKNPNNVNQREEGEFFFIGEIMLIFFFENNEMTTNCNVAMQCNAMDGWMDGWMDGL